MKRSLFALLIPIVLAGCANKDDSDAMVPAQSSAKTFAAMVPAQSSARTPASRYLAFQHSIQIDTAEDKVSTIFETAQATCREAVTDLCTILESRINTGRAASASLKFRATPNGIRKLIAALSKQAEIADQSTTAEDLATPIEDTGRKLAMLNDYRSKLEALRGRANNDIDALIKVNRELSQVQSDLETIQGKYSQLKQRVETEILNVSIRSANNRSFWRPIALSMSEFGANLSQGVSIAITVIAYLIPWVFVLAVAAWAGRKLWRRWKTPKVSA